MSRELMELGLSTARAAAELVRGRAESGVSVAATKSSDVDVVTQTDRDSETLIRSVILAARPDDAFLGEEGGEEGGSGPGTSGVRWVVDPIDGTVNFLYGIPRYAVSIAAQVDEQTVAGVVIDVSHGTAFTAYVDDDGHVVAERDGEPIAVRAPAPLSQRLVATGFSYDAEQRRRQAEALVRLLPEVRDIRRAGAAALDLCDVACGRLDAYVEEGVHLWDFAAAALVAQGAGATVEVGTGTAGRTLVVCAPRHGFTEFREAVQAAGFGPV
ncbi:inositol monophosphatase family protein [Nocardioides sp. Kera G14]|uniref:inositol monophosphatase family protein n=1 Tax=Nocardioides sp. Kera G14 TaxID=2884264 RepID=UPI001D104577|nr:inositol monophosphatase family protein [Nocardioides sp. Kera G14]UDY22368.1 inositol monophosphatase [Nocardioides sp. Kera G14]